MRRFLEARDRYGVLATVNPDGTPLQAVIWYLVEDAGLVINSKVGRQWPTNLLRDPRCSLTVETGLDYVAIRGVAEAIGDQERAQADIAAMARRYDPPEQAERTIANQFQKETRISFLLRPRSVRVYGGLE